MPAWRWQRILAAVLRRVVADQVNGIFPDVTPHVHLLADVDSTAHLGGGGPDDLKVQHKHMENVFKKQTIYSLSSRDAFVTSSVSQGMRSSSKSRLRPLCSLPGYSECT